MIRQYDSHPGRQRPGCKHGACFLPLPPQPPTHPQFRLNELLPILWFLSPSYTAAWHVLIFQAELPIFRSGNQNYDTESPSKEMPELLFFSSLLASVFLMETWFTCHQKRKQKYRESCIRGDGQSLFTGILFQSDHPECWEEGFRERQFFQRGWVELLWHPREMFLNNVRCMGMPNCVSPASFVLSRMKLAQFNYSKYNNIKTQNILSTWVSSNCSQRWTPPLTSCWSNCKMWRS